MALGQKKSFRIIQLALGRGALQVEVKRITAPGHFG